MAKMFGKKGFTLVELVVVIAILSVLVGITVLLMSDMTAGARTATDIANARALSSMAQVHFFEHKTYPNWPASFTELSASDFGMLSSDVRIQNQRHFFAYREDIGVVQIAIVESPEQDEPDSPLPKLLNPTFHIQENTNTFTLTVKGPPGSTVILYRAQGNAGFSTFDAPKQIDNGGEVVFSGLVKAQFQYAVSLSQEGFESSDLILVYS